MQGERVAVRVLEETPMKRTRLPPIEMTDRRSRMSRTRPLGVARRALAMMREGCYLCGHASMLMLDRQLPSPRP
jgi:hypothetical protein